jgi:cell division septation protein DedD
MFVLLKKKSNVLKRRTVMLKKILFIGLCLPFFVLLGCASKNKVVKPETELNQPQVQQEDPVSENTHPLDTNESLMEESSGPYSILLSSCRLQESVQKVLTKYKKAGLNPYAVKVDLGKKGIWWRIYAGHYESREKAIKEKSKYGLSDKIVLKR